MGSHSHCQGVFPSQGSNSGLLHCRQSLYHLNHQGSPRILEWVAYSSPGDLPDPGIEPESPALQAHSLPAELPRKTHNQSLVPTFFLLYPKTDVQFSSVQLISVAQSCQTLCDPIDCPWNSLGQNTGGGSLSLLQGIFPTQELNPGLPHCRRILYQLNHQGSPRILEWVAIPPPGDLPDPGIKPGSPVLQNDSLPSKLPGKPRFMLFWNFKSSYF